MGTKKGTKRYTYTKKVQKRYTLKRVPSNKGDQNGYEKGTKNGYRNSKYQIGYLSGVGSLIGVIDREALSAIGIKDNPEQEMDE